MSKKRSNEAGQMRKEEYEYMMEHGTGGNEGVFQKAADSQISARRIVKARRRGGSSAPAPAPAAAPAPIVLPSPVKQNPRDRLVAFYTKHNPAKLDNVDGTLAKYEGREDELFAALERKYAPTLAKESSPAAAMNPFANVNLTTTADPAAAAALATLVAKAPSPVKAPTAAPAAAAAASSPAAPKSIGAVATGGAGDGAATAEPAAEGGGGENPMLAVVDSNDQFISWQKAKTVEWEMMLHRSAQVLAFDSEGKLLIHQRSTDLPSHSYPGFWDVTTSNNVEKRHYKGTSRMSAGLQIVSCPLGYKSLKQLDTT
jgi:hypothetical protein